jgi:hypothetical protein
MAKHRSQRMPHRAWGHHVERVGHYFDRERTPRST